MSKSEELERKPIEEIEVELTQRGSLIQVSAIVCNVKPVRKLESDYKDNIKKIKEFKNMHREDLNRVNILNILNAELEKNLKTTIDLLNSLKHGMSITGDFDLSVRDIDKVLIEIKRRSE